MDYTVDPGRQALIDEVRDLKRTVKALALMLRAYRNGHSLFPVWVFNYIKAAKARYGHDLTRII